MLFIAETFPSIHSIVLSLYAVNEEGILIAITGFVLRSFSPRIYPFLRTTLSRITLISPAIPRSQLLSSCNPFLPFKNTFYWKGMDWTFHAFLECFHGKNLPLLVPRFDYEHKPGLVRAIHLLSTKISTPWPRKSSVFTLAIDSSQLLGSYSNQESPQSQSNPSEQKPQRTTGVAYDEFRLDFNRNITIKDAKPSLSPIDGSRTQHRRRVENRKSRIMLRWKILRQWVGIVPIAESLASPAISCLRRNIN